MVCRASGSYGRVFKALYGVTQGGPLSPHIFNLMVDTIIQEWMKQMLSAEAANNGIGEEVRLLLACFYTDNSLIALRDPDFLQQAFDTLTDLFDWVGLKTNTTKTETMTFLPGIIRTCLSEDSYRKQMDDHFRKSG